MKRTIYVIALFFLVVFCGRSSADILYLRNGNVVKGSMVKEDDKQVVFMVGGEGGVEVTFYKDEIIRIEKEDHSWKINVPLGADREVGVPIPDFLKAKPIVTEKAGVQARAKSQAKGGADIVGAMSGSDIIDDIYEELIPLLDKEEANYFMEFSRIVEESKTKINASTMNVVGATADPGQLIELVGRSASEIEGVINRLERLSPTTAFIEFHNKYLDALQLSKGMFLKMRDGDVQAIQEDISAIQKSAEGLGKELESILVIKRLAKTQ